MWKENANELFCLLLHFIVQYTDSLLKIYGGMSSRIVNAVLFAVYLRAPMNIKSWLDTEGWVSSVVGLFYHNRQKIPY